MPMRSNCPEHMNQRRLAENAPRPILNVACKEDPAGLADFGAVNVDIQRYDPSLGMDLTQAVPNFVHGNAVELPFEDQSFGTVVYGEFLEHCEFHAAVKALTEGKRVLRDDGIFILTFPKDGRSREGQHEPPVVVEFSSTLKDGTVQRGFWSCHVTVWTDELLQKLYDAVGIEEATRQKTTYILGGVYMSGLALTLRKRVMAEPVDGTCCDCKNSSAEETPCTAREDEIHCNHWWEGTPEESE
jgi:SAM-dependent methyltransferase